MVVYVLYKLRKMTNVSRHNTIAMVPHATQRRGFGGIRRIVSSVGYVIQSICNKEKYALAF